MKRDNFTHYEIKIDGMASGEVEMVGEGILKFDNKFYYFPLKILIPTLID
jgi:hypothetical protein